MKPITKTLANLSAAVALAFGGSAAQAQTITIKYSHFLASNTNFQKGIAEPWCAVIEKDSNGKIKCQIYPSLQLGGTPAQLADQVKHGVADVAWTSPSYTTGRFPRSEALELPFTMPADGLAGSRAMWEFAQKNVMEDYKDFKLLAIFSGTNQIIHTASKPILTVDSFKGLRLRSPSRSVSLFMSALGAIPVNMPVAQITEGISKGIIDGAMVPWEVVPAAKIDEVTKYHMETAPNQLGFVQSPLIILMNKAKYESLPADLKKVIDKHSGLALVELAAKVFDDGTADARKKVLSINNKILTIKPEDYAAMQKATASIETDWIKQANAKGLDGAKLAAEAHAVGKKYLSK